MHIAEVVTIAKSLPLLRLNTYKSLILSYSADYRRIFLKNYNIDSLVNSINHRDRNEIGQRITIPRLFVIDSTSVIPDSIILNFGTHSIISNVKYKKSKPFVLSTSDR